MSYLSIEENGTSVGPKKIRTLRFCVKLRNDNVLDTENWIQGNYSIYRIGDECPKGILVICFLIIVLEISDKEIIIISIYHFCFIRRLLKIKRFAFFKTCFFAN